MSQTKFQLQGQGVGQPGNGSSLQKISGHSDLRMPSRWMHRARVQQGESFFASSLAIAALALSTSGSSLRTFSRNKHLQDKPDCFVVLCFVCLFLLFVPDLALPRCFTGEWGCWHAAGAMLALGLPPLAWAVSHASPPHAAPQPPSARCFSLPQERLQGEAVRDAVPGPGRLRSGTWGRPRAAAWAQGCSAGGWEGVGRSKAPSSAVGLMGLRVNHFCPRHHVFPSAKTCRGAGGEQLVVDAKPPVLSTGCPATWLPDPRGSAQSCLTACLDPAG